MATQGPLICGTGVDDASVGTVTWTSPSNITAEDGTSAMISNASYTSHYLKATNFGFSIPSTATIDGIYAEWKIRGNPQTVIHSVKIVKGGTIGGTEQSGQELLGSTLVWKGYGGSSNLWGLSFTPTDINSSTFGCVYAARQPSSEASVQTYADACRITVYYTDSSGGSSLTGIQNVTGVSSITL